MSDADKVIATEVLEETILIYRNALLNDKHRVAICMTNIAFFAEQLRDLVPESAQEMAEDAIEKAYVAMAYANFKKGQKLDG